ncbi:hypothetical protein C0J52_16387 [Blattella germanica]|nr:hypothetical protein C0J52_16387 [Blattella germanica]
MIRCGPSEEEDALYTYKNVLRWTLSHLTSDNRTKCCSLNKNAFCCRVTRRRRSQRRRKDGRRTLKWVSRSFTDLPSRPTGVLAVLINFAGEAKNLLLCTHSSATHFVHWPQLHNTLLEKLNSAFSIIRTRPKQEVHLNLVTRTLAGKGGLEWTRSGVSCCNEGRSSQPLELMRDRDDRK